MERNKHLTDFEETKEIVIDHIELMRGFKNAVKRNN